jgi:hypothetical protein
MDINIDGPDGNAYAIMGYVSRLLKECGRGAEVKSVLDEMKSGDYENLLKVAERATNGSLRFVGRKR